MTHGTGSAALSLSHSLSEVWGAEPVPTSPGLAGWTPPPSLEVGAPCMVVARDSSRFQNPSGRWIDIRRRHVLRRILGALVAGHQHEPGSSVSSDTLFDAGWPGERISQASKDNRLRVAIATLRAMGLTEVISTARRGYRLSPRAEIRLEAERPKLV